MTASPSTPSSWARRAASLYDGAYARRYRAHDEDLPSSAPYRVFADWLERACWAGQPPLDVLDLGCGTGRYFCALSGVRELVGIDASASMLAEAAHPFHEDRITAASVRLIEDDLLQHRFEPGRFDLVYSIGVLAEHTPLDALIVSRVAEWLKPGGRFAFTTVHPESASVPRTMSRRLGGWIARALPGAPGRRLRDALLAGGLYADERRVRDLLEPAFDIESLERVESEAHLHCLCVARKRAA